MNNKFEKLQTKLNEMGKQGLCLAFSGGIDSALLLYLCKNMNITAVTFASEFHTKAEINETKEFCNEFQVNHKVIKISVLNDENIKNNPKDRCYHCKKKMFQLLNEFAKENNLKYIIDGTNYDDLSVFRPGLKALKELKIMSPFAECEITKQEIRQYAKNLGISIYNKPSTPCLATRFTYNTELKRDEIRKVEQCEIILHNLGFENSRLRLHNDIARIEIETEKFNDFILKKDEIIKKLKQTGIKYVTLDIEGIRSGSMDIV